MNPSSSHAFLEPLETRALLSTASIANLAVPEGSPALFTVSLDAPLSTPASIRYATVDATARAGRNYAPAHGTLVIPAGQTSAQFSVRTLDDHTFAADKTFRVLLTPPPGLRLSQRFATATITNTDPAPVISFANVNPQVHRPRSGSRTMSFILKMTGRSETLVRVQIATADGTALAGRDYRPVRQVLTFATGRTRAQVQVVVRGTPTPGPDEDFLLTLATPGGATLAEPFATGTILDKPTISAGNVVSIVSDTLVAGGSPAQVQFTLNHRPATPVTVSYQTVDGSALAGANYTPTAGTLTFQPGQITRTLSIPTQPLASGSKTFSVKLLSATNATLGWTTDTVNLVPTGTPVPPPGTGIGIHFDPKTSWVYYRNVRGNVLLNYVLDSTRTAPVSGLSIRFIFAPQNADISATAPYRVAPVSGILAPGGQLTGSADASGMLFPIGIGGYWQVTAQLVDTKGLIYDTLRSQLLSAA